MKVKANEELFNKFEPLSFRLRDLRAIIQNDMEISWLEIKDWVCMIDKIKEEIDNLKLEVLIAILVGGQK